MQHGMGRYVTFIQPQNLNQMFKGVMYEKTAGEQASSQIHATITKNSFQITITMHSGLVEHIHSFHTIVVDYMFKPVCGDSKAWMVAGWSPHYQQHEQNHLLLCFKVQGKTAADVKTIVGLTVATLYCNKATQDTFFQLFIEFAGAILQTTNKPLSLHTFDLNGTLHAITIDAEIAQIQGLGDWLALWLKVDQSPVKFQNPNILLPYVLKLCNVHF